MDILQHLFAKNANEILQSILLYLDFKTIHDARTVSKKWNEIICDLVWNSKKGREVLKRRQILKWTQDPKVMAYDFHDEMFVYKKPWDAVAMSFAVDERILVCCLSHVGEGGAKVIDVESRTIIAHLDHQKDSSEKRKLAVTHVVMTKNWIVTTTETRIYAWRRDNYALFKEFVIDRRERVNIGLTATESKKHLFIYWKVWEEKRLVYRISPTDSQVTTETIPEKSWNITLANGMLISFHLGKPITIYNLEVSGMEMFKLVSEHCLDTRRPCSQVCDYVSYPYYLKPEEDVDYDSDEGSWTINNQFVSIWNLQTGEMINRLKFEWERDGYLRGVMLKNDILVIRFKEENYYLNNVKFYIYDVKKINMKSSESSPPTPINVIHRGYEEEGDVKNSHHFRINNFSIIENIEDTFVFSDFC